MFQTYSLLLHLRVYMFFCGFLNNRNPRRRHHHHHHLQLLAQKMCHAANMHILLQWVYQEIQENRKRREKKVQSPPQKLRNPQK